MDICHESFVHFDARKLSKHSDFWLLQQRVKDQLLVDDIGNLDLLAANLNLSLGLQLALILLLLEFRLYLVLKGVGAVLCLVLGLLGRLPLQLLALGPLLLNLDLAFNFDFSLGLGLGGLESNWRVLLELVAELQLGGALVDSKDNFKVFSEFTGGYGVLEFIALEDLERGLVVLGQGLWGFGRLADGGLVLEQSDGGIDSDRDGDRD